MPMPKAGNREAKRRYELDPDSTAKPLPPDIVQGLMTYDDYKNYMYKSKASQKTFIHCQGKTQHIAAWCRELGISNQTFLNRISNLQWSISKSINTAPQHVGKGSHRKRKPASLEDVSEIKAMLNQIIEALVVIVENTTEKPSKDGIL